MPRAVRNLSRPPVPALTDIKAPSQAPAPALVPAIERATRLLDALSLSDAPLPLHSLQKSTGLPKSSLHGVLTTLCALGLAMRHGEAGYSLGPHSLQWADAFARQSRVLHAFQNAGEALQALANETVMLAVLQTNPALEVQYLACHQGQRAMAVAFRVGGRFPASCTSSGKAMLATYPTEQVQSLIGEGPLPTLTARSLQTPKQLLTQLASFRKQGYAVDDEETAIGMQCFGAPVFSAGQPTAVAAVAVSLIKASISPQQRKQVVNQIGALAQALSRQLGAA